MGEFGARKVKSQNKTKRWKKTTYASRILGLRIKKDPLEGAPQAKGIVIAKKGIEQKQPHSGIIKAVRVQLLKNGKEITAFLPRTGATAHVNEHDEVLIEGLGGSQGGPIGSMHGVRWRVIKVNNISLESLRSGKKKRGVK
ncbi:MAG: 30S ribosomal protein S12 [Candidatus Aenigmarchaeota archaeon]|nr:30S ribosomal protein S12 [Candidatus Aenigmarchaeota archaeon]